MTDLADVCPWCHESGAVAVLNDQRRTRAGADWNPALCGSCDNMSAYIITGPLADVLWPVASRAVLRNGDYIDFLEPGIWYAARAGHVMDSYTRAQQTRADQIKPLLRSLRGGGVVRPR